MAYPVLMKAAKMISEIKACPSLHCCSCTSLRRSEVQVQACNGAWLHCASGLLALCKCFSASANAIDKIKAALMMTRRYALQELRVVLSYHPRASKNAQSHGDGKRKLPNSAESWRIYQRKGS
jgi:hypothetical protein